jgi:ABC-type multidrug transport system fused ATPase/permease subunit
LGRTGSGKTTLARLLLRLYDYQAGEICLSNIPLGLASLRELRRRVGIVTQDVQLFHATVRDNLTFFNRTIPDERILAVLEDLGLAPWYRSLPLGLDSELGSDGDGLSAGEGAPCRTIQHPWHSQEELEECSWVNSLPGVERQWWTRACC